ncbi:hypothetical protein ACEK06_19505 [Pseudomonas brenneri]|uniref:hypothetical protein n=1 Tax=Pseudomonas brenneri TaxID=129817 RepID=UPI00357160A5
MFPKKVITDQIKKMRKNSVSDIGFFWYANAEQYDQYLLIYEDRDAMHDSFALWHKQAMQTLEKFKRRGFNTQKICSTPQELIEWCRANNMPLTGKGRSAFVQYKISSGQCAPKSLKSSIHTAIDHQNR